GLGLIEQVARDRDGRDLAARDLLSLCDRLAVHHREHRQAPELIDGLDQVTSHSHETTPHGDEPRLALHRRTGLEPRACKRGRQSRCGHVLVNVARLQLDDVDLAGPAHRVKVLGPQHRAFAQLVAEVVDEYASFNVAGCGGGSSQTNRTHNWEHRERSMGARSGIRLYNTMTRRKEDLRPLEAGHVRIYTCGPTVYRYAHIGNLRTYMFADVLTRSLEYLGHDAHQVMNITDVGHLTDDTFDRGEDKMLVSARLEKKSPEEIAAYYTDAFMRDARLVNIRPAREYPRATDYIPQMIEIIAKLIELGHAYEVDGTAYFDIASFPPYGRLSRNTTDQLLSGTRGEVDPRKRHPGDFTLWKAAGEHRVQLWPSPWGPGFPGWHIECSAMSMALLGDRFDIHTGGADNVFPHHEAEIAQSEGVTGHQVVSCWVHGEHLMLSGARMAKS